MTYTVIIWRRVGCALIVACALLTLYMYFVIFRYSMGVKTVNIDQVDETKMDAHVKIRIPETEKLDCDTDIFSLIQCSNMDEDGTKTTCKDTEKDVNQSGLRKRNVKSENPSKEDHIEEVIKTDADKNTKANENNGENELEKKRLFDPIKWFGVLVPGSLKQSQVEFRKCIEVAVNVGNLQTKLENFRKNYRTLLKLKKNKFSETEDQL